MDENTEENTVVHLRNAGFDTSKVPGFVNRIDNLLDEMETKKSEYMTWCKNQRESINYVYDEAKDADIPKRELKAVMKARALGRRARAAIEDLEPEQQDTCQLIREALGELADTPLGQSALGNDADALDDLTSDAASFH